MRLTLIYSWQRNLTDGKFIFSYHKLSLHKQISTDTFKTKMLLLNMVILLCGKHLLFNEKVTFPTKLHTLPWSFLPFNLHVVTQNCQFTASNKSRFHNFNLNGCNIKFSVRVEGKSTKTHIIYSILWQLYFDHSFLWKEKLFLTRK